MCPENGDVLARQYRATWNQPDEPGIPTAGVDAHEFELVGRVRVDDELVKRQV